MKPKGEKPLTDAELRRKAELAEIAYEFHHGTSDGVRYNISVVADFDELQRLSRPAA